MAGQRRRKLARDPRGRRAGLGRVGLALSLFLIAVAVGRSAAARDPMAPSISPSPDAGEVDVLVVGAVRPAAPPPRCWPGPGIGCAW